MLNLFHTWSAKSYAFLAFQVHYKNAMKPDHRDSSGVQLLFDQRQVAKRAGVLLMGSTLGIPPLATSEFKYIWSRVRKATL